jgi:hypothetical protein
MSVCLSQCPDRMSHFTIYMDPLTTTTWSGVGHSCPRERVSAWSSGWECTVVPGGRGPLLGATTRQRLIHARPRMLVFKAVRKRSHMIARFKSGMSLSPTCEICEESYDKDSCCPRMLPCGHTICHTCAERLISGDAKVCPKCRVAFK